MSLYTIGLQISSNFDVLFTDDRSDKYSIFNHNFGLEYLYTKYVRTLNILNYKGLRHATHSNGPNTSTTLHEKYLNFNHPCPFS